MELKFASQEEALQHLADLTGKRIKIATEDMVDELLDIVMRKPEILKDVTLSPKLQLKIVKEDHSVIEYIKNPSEEVKSILEDIKKEFEIEESINKEQYEREMMHTRTKEGY